MYCLVKSRCFRMRAKSRGALGLRTADGGHRASGASMRVLTVAVHLLALALTLAGQPVQKCTSQNIRGFPIEGFVCGGSTHALNCSPGAVYRCKKGNQFETNNCTLYQACATACIT